MEKYNKISSKTLSGTESARKSAKKKCNKKCTIVALSISGISLLIAWILDRGKKIVLCLFNKINFSINFIVKHVVHFVEGKRE